MKNKIVLLLLATTVLQIKSYCAPKVKSIPSKESKWKSFSLSGNGYLFSEKKGKVYFTEFDGYSIPIKIFEKRFFHFLTILPCETIESFVAYLLYFRSFYVELIKSLKRYNSTFTMYNKGRHRISRTPFINVDFGYSLNNSSNSESIFVLLDNEQKNDVIKAVGSECVICMSKFANNEEIAAHYDPENDKLIHPHHKNCLGDWLNHSKSCPSCRKKINTQKITKKIDQARLVVWQDIFKLSFQITKFTYEYALSNYRDFFFSLRGSVCLFIFTTEIPLVFFRHLSLKEVRNNKKDDNNKSIFTFNWRNCLSDIDFITLSFCGKFSIGCFMSIQKVGVLFELSYVKAYFEGTFDIDSRFWTPNKDNEDKGYRFEFKITFLIKDI